MSDFLDILTLALVLSVPVFAVNLLYLLIDSGRPEGQNTKEGRLLLSCLLTVPVAALGAAGFVLILWTMSYLFPDAYVRLKPTLPVIGATALWVYAVLLCDRLLLRLLSLTKKNRRICITLLMLLFAALVIVFCLLAAGVL